MKKITKTFLFGLEILLIGGGISVFSLYGANEIRKNKINKFVMENQKLTQ
ncbi:Uncharacterised protein [Mycoplasmopsis edwardii]|uniref:Uncharacterized protein n=1 Tax=Mycoplasmopsis edwardii TaxID=53558 RepID=A0A3B0PU59_9BACT|nr:hypothetical protein [Mycoplasmopsis edwardii]SYV96954.1 Uncharacterised protein [Mycoplasmopsis edwardii]